ncbi:unnamed protein product, partial [Brenthis ino]
MNPQCLNSDSSEPEAIIISDDDDIIPISPPPLTEIDITESEENTVLLNSETAKSQRKSHIEKIFPSQSSSGSSVPTAVNVKETTQTISTVRVVFPVKPYPSQVHVMSKVIRAIKDKENCLVESPTGTGKTLALLCASLAWQLQEKENIKKSVVEIHPELDPEKQQPSPNKTNTTFTAPLFTKQNFGGKSIYDNSIEDIGKPFLNVIQNQPGPSTATSDNDSSEDNLVRLHKKPRYDTSYVDLTSSHCPTKLEKKVVPEPTTPEKNTLPVIFYGARTHKQLEQVVQEYAKTMYCDQATMTILSSRENSCIRSYDSHQWSSKKEMCKSCTKSASSNNNKTCCEYYNNRKKLDHKSLPSAFDLNILRKKGEELRACPYYAARYMKANANIVFCPYNFLIDPSIRSSMQIDFKNDIIIIDEGHNIEDICRETATFSFTTADVQAALKELNYALSFRFANQDVETFIEHLIQVLNNWDQWFGNQIPLLEKKAINENVVVYDWDVRDFIQTLGYHNIGQGQYLDFKKNVTLLSDKIRNNPDTLKQVTTPTVSLLESLNNILGYIFGKYLDSYKPKLELKFKPFLFENNEWTNTPFRNKSNWEYLKLHLYCLNPAVVFSGLCAARTVVLASGTLTPVASLESELDTAFPFKVSAKHIIPDDRVWVGTLGLHEDGSELVCRSAELRRAGTRRALGRALRCVCDVTPHGVLCFLPSYTVLKALVKEWNASGILKEIERTKEIFQESNNVKDHEIVMKSPGAKNRSIVLRYSCGKTAVWYCGQAVTFGAKMDGEGDIFGANNRFLLENASNWHTWKFQVKVILKAVNAYDLVDGLLKCPENDDTKLATWKAQAVIVGRLGSTAMLHIQNCETAREIWDKLNTIYEQKSDVSLHILQQRFFEEKYIGSEDVSTFIAKIEAIVTQVRQAKVPKDVVIGDGTIIKALGYGDIDLEAYDGQQWIKTLINNVLYVPSIKVNLFSMSAALDKGYKLESTATECQFIKNNSVYAIAKRHGKMYTMLFKKPDACAMVGKVMSNLREWHTKLAHQDINQSEEYKERDRGQEKENYIAFDTQEDTEQVLELEQSQYEDIEDPETIESEKEENSIHSFHEESAILEEEIEEEQETSQQTEEVTERPRRARKKPSWFKDYEQGDENIFLSYSCDEPISYQQAMKRPDKRKWEEAINKELQTLEENNTWEEVAEVPDGENINYTKAATTSGALLLAVYRGKAAEGVDFRDRQARAVVLVGVPFPNIKDEAVRSKMEYNDNNALKMKLLSGSDWLYVQAFRALNQAVGRSVRHARDWGAVLLLDARYRRPNYTRHISEWARRRLEQKQNHNFSSLINHPSGIKAFMEIMTQKEAGEETENEN